MVEISFSIVSHGQVKLVHQLLSDLNRIKAVCFEVIITINIAEDDATYLDFPNLSIVLVKNTEPKGFGANHNSAFHIAKGDYFAVVNPDVRLSELDIKKLTDALSAPDVGVAAPAVFSPQGHMEDSARRFPTIKRIISRKLVKNSPLDYDAQPNPVEVDWVAGIFMLFPRGIYQMIGGFDERYFMYLEDADLCRKLGRAGYKTVWVPTTSVVHDAQRASRRQMKPFLWHLQSLLQFLLGR